MIQPSKCQGSIANGNPVILLTVQYSSSKTVKHTLIYIYWNYGILTNLKNKTTQKIFRLQNPGQRIKLYLLKSKHLFSFCIITHLIHVIFQGWSWTGLRDQPLFHNVLHGLQLLCKFHGKTFKVFHLLLWEFYGTLWTTLDGGAPSAETWCSTRKIRNLGNTWGMEASLIILWFPSHFLGVNIAFSSPDPIRSFNSTKLILPKVFPPTFLNHRGPQQKQTNKQKKSDSEWVQRISKCFVHKNTKIKNIHKMKWWQNR